MTPISHDAHPGAADERPRSRWRLLPVILVLGLAWVGVFFLQRAEHRSGMTGRPAPPLAITTFDGNPIALADLRGRGVVVNFWASWCEPCRAEAGLLEAAWRAHQAEITFIGVNTQDTQAAARAFLAEYGVSYPNGPDTVGWGRQFGVSGLPATFFIDPQGVVRRVVLGPITHAADLERHLDEIRGVGSGG
ncbi:MAG: TlpA family protein disulfide reductase [Caldilineaceae bacterium]|nr:TlpA family protein disulfide reductase [Caldilineaceae bacterium]